MKSPLNNIRESNVRFSPIYSPKTNSAIDRKRVRKDSIKTLIETPATTSSHDAQAKTFSTKEEAVKDTKVEKVENAVNEEETIPMNIDKEDKSSREEIERARVAKDISHLMATVKGLQHYYKLIDKIGEGSFSTVYKAQDLRRKYYNNDEWEPQLLSNAENAFISPASTPVRDEPQSPSKVLSDYVALKHIYHTSSPRRIANEIKILRQLKGSKCISPLITAFRQEDHIFVVMPYIQHDDFKKTFFEMELIDIKYYMKSIMTALQQLHRYKILHRDVKPNNFLYNIRKRTGYLIDFGLAESENECKALEQYVQKQAKRSPYSMYARPTKQNNGSNNSNTANPKNTTTPVLSALTNKPSVVPSFTSSISSTKSVSSSNSTTSSMSNSTGDRINFRRRVAGYVRNDPRHSIRANRAGTRGFRAPEILMRVTSQTCAIDIWAVGVILLSLLTGRYPFFLANDEAESLIEIAQIYGHKEMKEAAVKYNRHFTTNVPIPPERMPFERLCEVLNKERIHTWDQNEFKQGIDFLNRCLELDHNTRITAAEALEHPFLQM